MPIRRRERHPLDSPSALDWVDVDLQTRQKFMYSPLYTHFLEKRPPALLEAARVHEEGIFRDEYLGHALHAAEAAQELPKELLEQIRCAGSLYRSSLPLRGRLLYALEHGPDGAGGS